MKTMAMANNDSLDDNVDNGGGSGNTTTVATMEAYTTIN